MQSPPRESRGHLSRRTGTVPCSPLPHLPSSHSSWGGRSCQGWKAPPSSPQRPSSLPPSLGCPGHCATQEATQLRGLQRPRRRRKGLWRRRCRAGRAEGCLGSGMQPPSLLLLWLLGSWAVKTRGEDQGCGTRWKRGAHRPEGAFGGLGRRAEPRALRRHRVEGAALLPDLRRPRPWAWCQGVCWVGWQVPTPRESPVSPELGDSGLIWGAGERNRLTTL